jgi:hypothetical protein
MILTKYILKKQKAENIRIVLLIITTYNYENRKALLPEYISNFANELTA